MNHLPVRIIVFHYLQMRDRIRRYFLPLLIILTCAGCMKHARPTGGIETNGREEVNFTDATELSGEIITFSSYLYHEKGLELDDSFVCFDDGKITRVRLDYSTMDIVDLCEARQLLVDVVEGMTHVMNLNNDVANRLGNFPVTVDNLEIYIRFVSFFSRYIDVRKIGLVTLNRGIAGYYGSDALNCDIQCWHRRVESYQQSKVFADYYKEGEYFYGPKYDMYGLPLDQKDDGFYLDVGERFKEQRDPWFSTKGIPFNNQSTPSNNFNIQPETFRPDAPSYNFNNQTPRFQPTTPTQYYSP